MKDYEHDLPGPLPRPPQPDHETNAISVVLRALKPLDSEARRRVLEYVRGRLDAEKSRPEGGR